MTRQEIAREMHVSPWTVKEWFDNMRNLLCARNLPQAIALCIARGYLCVDGRTEKVYIPEPPLMLVS